MADVQLLYYHGIRENIRRVLTAMGEERVDKGLTAFEDGSHNWSNCFFARAFNDEFRLDQQHNPELRICQALNLFTTDNCPNYVPVRLVWHTFDGASKLITAEELKQFIEDVRDESRDPGALALLRSLDFTHVEDLPIEAKACGWQPTERVGG